MILHSLVITRKSLAALLCFVLLGLANMACQKEKNQNIIGEWNAVSITENKKALALDLTEINFTFQDNEIYTYSSTLNYQEAGKFYLKANYLYTTDTLNKASTEKVVELIKITPDTIVMRMEEMGKERLLTLAKVQVQ